MTSGTAAGTASRPMQAPAQEGGAPAGHTDTTTTAPLRPTLREERRLWRAGHRWVAGLDEVGRGAWAGPLSVGVVVVRHQATTRSLPPWLRDSKQLAEERREVAFHQVARWCVDGAVGHTSAAECDELGMTAALRLAAVRALAGLEVVPEALIVDGPYDLLRPRQLTLIDPLEPGVLPPVVVPVVDGDARCAAVAAASILAKVSRDRIMRAEAHHYPFYEFDRNKGYPSPVHKAALRGYGLSAIHRRSWAFVDGLPWG